mmetsp:Transcript_9431/g.22345  ORF Transcript_9431/g.22345 Transcript_9431/m.22345 type:complete len:213 (+) Transcript_9431:497-1135(+)
MFNRRLPPRVVVLRPPLIIPLMLPLDVAHVYIVRFMPKRDARIVGRRGVGHSFIDRPPRQWVGDTGRGKANILQVLRRLLPELLAALEALRRLWVERLHVKLRPRRMHELELCHGIICLALNFRRLCLFSFGRMSPLEVPADAGDAVLRRHDAVAVALSHVARHGDGDAMGRARAPHDLYGCAQRSADGPLGALSSSTAAKGLFNRPLPLAQ